MEVIKNWFVSWATRNSDQVQAVICFGSYGRKDTSPSSDLDICVVGEKTCLIDILELIILDHPKSLCYEKTLDHKILALIRINDEVFRVDCFVAQKVSEVEKYIVGSELQPNNISYIMLFKNPLTGSAVEQQLLHMISNVSPTKDVREFVRTLLMSFIESFEVASNKRACGDKFQFLFQLQIAYTALVKLEFVRQEGRRFLYLPKMVFPYFDKRSSSESGQSTRRHFEDDLEPRGQLNGGHAQQVLYLEQFRRTLTGLLSSFPEVLRGIAQSVDHICDTLSLVLQRDRFYNFRDAGCGPLLRGLVYRSGFFELPVIVSMYGIKSVIDLRLEKEVTCKPSVFPADVVCIHCDIFNFGGRGKMSL
jgi:predicted nucleotidyltransferase